MAVGTRRQLSIVREGVIGVTPATPVMKIQKVFGGNGLKLDRDAIEVDDWRSDRTVREIRSGVNKVSANIPANLAYSTFDDLLESAMFGRFLPITGAQPITLAVALTIAAAGKTYSRASGSFLTDGFANGDFVIVSGFVNPTNNGVFRITTLTALVMTFSEAVDLVDEVLATGAKFDRWNGLPLQLGATTLAVAADTGVYTRSAGSFLTEGVAIGDYVTISGCTNGANNGTFKVNNVTALILTTNNTASVVEAAAANRAYMDLTMVLKDSVYPVSFSAEEFFTDILAYKTMRGLLVNQFQLNLKTNDKVSATFDLIGISFGGTTAMASSYTQPPSNPTFDSFTGSISEGGLANTFISELDLTVTNGAVPKYFLFSRNAALIDVDDFNLTGTLKIYFKDNTILNKFLNETDSSITFTFQDLLGNTLICNLPKVRYTGGNPNIQKTDITLELPFQALFDTVSGCHIQWTRKQA